MTSCLRMVPKFSTFNSLAIELSSVMLMAWSLAMLRDEAILSRCEPRSSWDFGSSSATVGSIGLEGGCRAGSGGAAGAGDDSTGISSDGFAFGFLATLGIKNIIQV